jgi:ATP-dependent Clp protease ATP-binding subunit ClpA
VDDGRLTDGRGRVVNFKNTVIIMTSNIGSDLILDWGKRRGEIGFVQGNDSDEVTPESQEAVEAMVRERLRDHFRPEFLNRVDEVVMFQALQKKELAVIVDLQLQQVAKRLLDKRIHLSFSEKAKKLIADKGYDPSYGARPLKRAIQDQVLDELAMELLEHKINEGDRVMVDVSKEKIVFKKEREEKKEIA